MDQPQNKSYRVYLVGEHAGFTALRQLLYTHPDCTVISLQASLLEQAMKCKDHSLLKFDATCHHVLVLHPEDVSLLGSTLRRAELPCAVVGLLEADATIDHALCFSGLNVDGVLRQPLKASNLQVVLDEALTHHSRSRQVMSRSYRLRKLCQALNRDRRLLRDKVDLLCQDFVGGSRRLAGKLDHYRRLCDFQKELIGQYDLLYLTHHALSVLKADWHRAGAVLYLEDGLRPAAHLVGQVLPQQTEPEAFENCLAEFVVPKVMQQPHGWRNKSEQDLLGGDGLVPLSYLGLSLDCNYPAAGIVLFYREPIEPFGVEDADRVRIQLPSLVRAIASARQVQTAQLG